MSIIITILEQSFLLFPLIIGVYLSYSIIKITDLSVDGSFVLGAVIAAKLISSNFASPILAIIIASFGGGLAGIFVGIIQKNNRIDPLIAGIIMAFMLYSINLQVMEKPNISLMGLGSFMDYFYTPLIFAFVMATIAGIAFLIFIHSKLGLFLRAFGDNQNLLTHLGLNAELFRVIGLATSNMLAAFSGAITAQYYYFSDINMGFGMTITSIAAVIIGLHFTTVFFNKETGYLFKELIGCFVGIIIYYLLFNILLLSNIDPINLRLVLGIFLIIILRSIRTKKVKHA